MNKDGTDFPDLDDYEPEAIAIEDYSDLHIDEALDALRNKNAAAIEGTMQESSEEASYDEALEGSAISRLSSNVREESVEIAREILRKLKVTLGNTLVEEGLNLKILDKDDIFDAFMKVMDIYEYLLATARALDEEILENAIIYNANMAVGQIKHMMQLDALRVAQHDGQTQQAQALAKNIESMPSSWKTAAKTTFRELFQKIEDGMETILSRIDQLKEVNTMADTWRGLTNYKTVGGRESEADQREKRVNRMAEHEEFRDLMIARKQAQQAQFKNAMSATSAPGSKRSQDHDHEEEHKQRNSSRNNQQRMGKLLNNDMLSAMRRAMGGIPKNAAPVQVGLQEAIRRSVRKQLENAEMRDQMNAKAHHKDGHHDHHHEQHHESHHDHHHEHDHDMVEPPIHTKHKHDLGR